MTEIHEATNSERDASNSYTLMNDINIPNDSLLTIAQLFDLFPYANGIGWKRENVEFLYDEGLIEGKHEEGSGELLIRAGSFAKILDFHKKQQKG